MYRLLYRTFIGMAFLFTVLVICVVGTRLFSKPLTIFATNPQGVACDRWCLFGVEPEAMGYARVQYMLTTHPLVHGLDIIPANSYDYFLGQDVDVAHGPGYVSIEYHAPVLCTGSSVAHPECYSRGNNRFLASLRSTVPLGVVIKELGAPDYVQPGTDKYGTLWIRLFYRKLRSEFIFQSDGRTVGASDQIVAIWYFSQDLFDDFAQRLPHYVWPGFGALNYSLSETNLQDSGSSLNS